MAKEPKTVNVQTDDMITASEYRLLYAAASFSNSLPLEKFIIKAAIREAARVIELRGAK